MLIDEIDITVSGGHGGAGRVSFLPKMGMGPDGGDGGRGGDVYVAASTDLYGLNQFLSKKKLSGENGQPGGKNRKFGTSGKDLVLTMPLGTFIINQETQEEIELNDLNQQLLLAKGGLGGRGNVSFKSPSNTTPRYAQKGLPGEEKRFNLRLKLIADFGLFGLPNAGKSSLLNELTNADVRIGAYPFTTLEPNLGVLKGRVIADIPGLIEGASEGKGLGHKFLKHIEKVKLLLHCISTESEDPMADYKTIHGELKKYNPELLKKDEVILLTKSDLVSKDELGKKIRALDKTKKKIIPISIHDWDSIYSLIDLLSQ